MIFQRTTDIFRAQLAYKYYAISSSKKKNKVYANLSSHKREVNVLFQGCG